MTVRCVRATILPAIVLAGAVGNPVLAQDVAGATGSILGSVFDSTTSAPLANARVAVVGTEVFAESNEEGRFRLDRVPAGWRTVVFYHDRLGDLGVGVTPARVLVDSESVSQVSLAVPSRSTILSAWCSAEPVEGPTSVGGIVTDALTGVPLPRATVRALGGSMPGTRVVREVKTEYSGEFRICNLDSSEPLAVVVAFGANEGIPVQLARSGPSIVDFAIDISEPVTITGSVLDQATRAPIPGAHVQLVGSDHSQVVDSAGAFGFSGVPPGKQIIETRMLGYVRRIDSLTVLSNEALGLEIVLATEAISLEPLVVVGRRNERVFTTPGTRFSGLTEAQVDSISHRVMDFAGLARAARMPGLSVTQRMMPSSGSDIMQEALCIEMQRSARSGNPNTCNMVHVRINDVAVWNAHVILQNINPQDVRRIQFITPIEAGVLYGTRGASGVLLIYTR